MGSSDRITGRSIDWVVFDELGDDVSQDSFSACSSSKHKSLHDIDLHIHNLERLLKMAMCPNEDCDQRGSIAIPVRVMGHDGEEDVDWEQQQCQWCAERGTALRGMN